MANAAASSFPLRQSVYFVALACAALGAHAQSAQPVQVAQATALKEVVVSGSRSEQDPDELPQTIDVINRNTVEEKQIRDIRDAARDLPNVSVQRAPARFTLAGQPAFGRDQNAGFNIRGLDGNRVLILVDGIRQPRSYVFSANAFGRDYLDIGLVQRMEIFRGATSALYGSDGMGGLVNFITNEPSVFLKPGKTIGGTASIGYDGDDKGVNVGATVAGRASDTVQWMIGANVSRADALDNMGTNGAPNINRTEPNPEEARGKSLLAKLVFAPNAAQKHTVTLEHVDKRSDYNLLSAVTGTTAAANAFTDMDRDRLTWNGRWRLDAAAADELQAALSWQEANSREYTFEDRTGVLTDRVRDTTYKERTVQANLQAAKTLRLGGSAAHKITYGLDYTTSDITNLQVGLTPAAGETFPLKRFPDTTEKSTAVYVQDEIVMGAWTVTPGLRVDRFDLDASQAGFSPPATRPAASLSGSATSPKLGVLFRATPQWSVYGNYAAGFKAPNANQVNGFFQSATGNYSTIPNPNLKPEKSRTFELGARGRLDRANLDFAVFTGRYRDFIEDNAQVSGNFTPANPTVFQTINVGNVRISGFEAKADVEWGNALGGRLSSPFSYGQAKGKDTRTGRALNSINPARFTAGLKYLTDKWSARLDVIHRAAKKAGDADTATGFTAPASQFLTPEATTLDLSGQWRIRKDLRLNAGIYNLTDKKYWNWSDVRGVPSNSTTLDAFTQPGRYVRVSLVADF